MAERRADEATRDVTNWLKCEYLQQHLGATFDGLISAVTGFGFFVELADLYVEGLVHVATLEGDFYQFDQQKQRLSGERTGKRFALGDAVQVKVSSINLEERKIDLILESQGQTFKSRRSKGGDSRAKGAGSQRKGRKDQPAGVYQSKGKSGGSSKDKKKGGKSTKVSNNGGQNTNERLGSKGSDAKGSSPKGSARSAGANKGKKTKTKSAPLKVGEDLVAPPLPAKQDVSLHDDAAPRRRAKLQPVSKPRKRKVDSDE